MARLRLETPGRIGMPRRTSARLEQCVAEAVALGAEGEDRARRQLGRAQVLAAGVDRDQRPVAGRQLRRPRPPAGRSGARRRRAGRRDARDRCARWSARRRRRRRRRPARRPPCCPSCAGPRAGPAAPAPVRRAPRPGRPPAGGRSRRRRCAAPAGTSSAISSAETGDGALGERVGEVRGQLGGELAQLRRIGGDRLEHLGAEAQRVLEGVEALEDGEAADRAAPCGSAGSAPARRPRSPAHHDPITAVVKIGLTP